MASLPVGRLAEERAQRSIADSTALRGFRERVLGTRGVRNLVEDIHAGHYGLPQKIDGFHGRATIFLHPHVAQPDAKALVERMAAAIPTHTFAVFRRAERESWESGARAAAWALHASPK